MKKILFVIAIVLTFGIGTHAQSDDFFREYDNFGQGNRDAILPLVITGAIGSSNDDQSALPLSDGLLVLSMLGAGYAIRKYRSGRK